MTIWYAVVRHEASRPDAPYPPEGYPIVIKRTREEAEAHIHNSRLDPDSKWVVVPVAPVPQCLAELEVFRQRIEAASK